MAIKNEKIAKVLPAKYQGILSVILGDEAPNEYRDQLYALESFGKAHKELQKVTDPALSKLRDDMLLNAECGIAYCFSTLYLSQLAKLPEQDHRRYKDKVELHLKYSQTNYRPKEFDEIIDFSINGNGSIESIDSTLQVYLNSTAFSEKFANDTSDIIFGGATIDTVSLNSDEYFVVCCGRDKHYVFGSGDVPTDEGHYHLYDNFTALLGGETRDNVLAKFTKDKIEALKQQGGKNSVIVLFSDGGSELLVDSNDKSNILYIQDGGIAQTSPYAQSYARNLYAGDLKKITSFEKSVIDNSAFKDVGTEEVTQERSGFVSKLMKFFRKDDPD